MKIEATTIKGNKITVDLATKAITLPDGKMTSFSEFSVERVDNKNATCLKSDLGLIALDQDSGKAISAAQSEYRTQKLEAAVPGVTLLRAAQEGEAAYFEAFNAMMDNEQNDGVNAPKATAFDTDELAAQYPRAALYLKADAYSEASHYAKSAAGRQAMTMLENGEAEDAASAVLNNWLNDTFID